MRFTVKQSTSVQQLTGAIDQDQGITPVQVVYMAAKMVLFNTCRDLFIYRWAGRLNKLACWALEISEINANSETTAFAKRTDHF